MSDRKHGIGILNAVVLLKSLLWSMTFFFLPLMFAGAGISGLEIGLLFAAMTATSILITFPIGILNDKLGTKGLIVLSLLLVSLYFFGIASVRSFWALLPMFVLGGIGSTVLDRSAIGMVYKKLEVFKRGRKLGAYYLAANIGSGAGLLIGGVVLFKLDFSLTLAATALFFMAITLLSLKLPDTRGARFPMLKYKKLLFRKDVLFLLIPLVLFSTHWGVEQTSYSLFLREGLGLGMVASGIYMGLPIIILGIFAFFSGVAIDRKKKGGKIFFIGLLLSGIGHLLMFLQPVYLSFAFRIIHEIGDAMVAVSYTVEFSKIFPKDTVAGNTGLMGLIMALGSIAGSMVFGPMGQAFGYASPFIISGMIGIASAGALALVKGRINT